MAGWIDTRIYTDSSFSNASYAFDRESTVLVSFVHRDIRVEHFLLAMTAVRKTDRYSSISLDARLTFQYDEIMDHY